MKRHSQINLRQGEFAYIQNYETILRSAATALKVISVALLLLGVSYFVMRTAYTQKIDALQAQYYSDLTKTFPDLAKQYRGEYVFASLRNAGTGMLNAQIEQKRQAVERFVSDNYASPALVVLREISEVIPKDVELNVTLFDFKTVPTGGKLTFRGETDGYESVANVLEAMKKVRKLSAVTEKNSAAKPGTDNVIEFVIEAEYFPDSDLSEEEAS